MRDNAITVLSVIGILVCFFLLARNGFEQDHRKERLKRKIELEIRGASKAHPISKDIEADILTQIIDSL